LYAHLHLLDQFRREIYCLREQFSRAVDLSERAADEFCLIIEFFHGGEEGVVLVHEERDYFDEHEHAEAGAVLVAAPEIRGLVQFDVVARVFPPLYVAVVPLREVPRHQVLHSHVVELLLGVFKELVGVPAGPLNACVFEGDECDGVAAEELYVAELNGGHGGVALMAVFDVFLHLGKQVDVVHHHPRVE